MYLYVSLKENHKKRRVDGRRSLNTIKPFLFLHPMANERRLSFINRSSTHFKNRPLRSRCPSIVLDDTVRATVCPSRSGQENMQQTK